MSVKNKRLKGQTLNYTLRKKWSFHIIYDKLTCVYELFVKLTVVFAHVAYRLTQFRDLQFFTYMVYCRRGIFHWGYMSLLNLFCCCDSISSSGHYRYYFWAYYDNTSIMITPFSYVLWALTLWCTYFNNHIFIRFDWIYVTKNNI